MKNNVYTIYKADVLICLYALMSGTAYNSKCVFKAFFKLNSNSLLIVIGYLKFYYC